MNPLPPHIPRPPPSTPRKLEIRLGMYGCMYMLGRDVRVISSFPLDKPVTHVGRDFSNDIRVYHESVSRMHFKITYDFETQTSYVFPLCSAGLPVDRLLLWRDKTTGLGHPLKSGTTILIGKREFRFMYAEEKVELRPVIPPPMTPGLRRFRLSFLPASDIIPPDPSKEQKISYPLLPEVAKFGVIAPTLVPAHSPEKPKRAVSFLQSTPFGRILSRNTFRAPDDDESPDNLNESGLFFGLTQDNADFVAIEEVEEDEEPQEPAEEEVPPEQDPLRHRLVRRILHHLQLPHLKQAITEQGFLTPQVPSRQMTHIAPATVGHAVASSMTPTAALTPKSMHELRAQHRLNVQKTAPPRVFSQLTPLPSLPDVFKEKKAARVAQGRTSKRDDTRTQVLRGYHEMARQRFHWELEAAFEAVQNGQLFEMTPLQEEYVKMRLSIQQPGALRPMQPYRAEDEANHSEDEEGVQDALEVGNQVMMEGGQHPGMEVYDEHGNFSGYWQSNGIPNGPPFGSPPAHYGAPAGPYEAPNADPNAYADVDPDMDSNAYPPVDPNIDPDLVNYQDPVPGSPPIHPGSPMDEDSPGWLARQTQEVQIPLEWNSDTNAWNKMQIDPALYAIDQSLAQGASLGELPTNDPHYQSQQQYQQQQQYVPVNHQQQDQQQRMFEQVQLHHQYELARQARLGQQYQLYPQFHAQGEAGPSYSQGGGLFGQVSQGEGLFGQVAQQLDQSQRLTAGDVDPQVMEESPFVNVVHTQAPQAAPQQFNGTPKQGEHVPEPITEGPAAAAEVMSEQVDIVREQIAETPVPAPILTGTTEAGAAPQHAETTIVPPNPAEHSPATNWEYTFYHSLGAPGRVRMPPDDGTLANQLLRNLINVGSRRVDEQIALRRAQEQQTPARTAKPRATRAKTAKARQATRSAADTHANEVPDNVTPVEPLNAENSLSNEEAIEAAITSPLIELKEKVAVLRRSSEVRDSIVAYNASLHQGNQPPADSESELQQFQIMPAQDAQVDADPEGSSSSDEFPALAPAQSTSNSITDINDILNSFDAPTAAGIPDIVLNDETNLLDQATEAADHQTPEITGTITGSANTVAEDVKEGLAADQVISSGEDSLEEVERSLSQIPDGDLVAEEDVLAPADHDERGAAIVETAAAPEISRPVEDEWIPIVQSAEKKAETEVVNEEEPTVNTEPEPDLSKKPVRTTRAGQTAAITKPAKPTPARRATRKTAPIEAARQEVLQDAPEAPAKAKASGRVRRGAKPSAQAQVAPAEAVEQVDELSQQVQEEVQEEAPKKTIGKAKGRSRKNVPAVEVIHAEVEVPAIQEVEAVAEKEQIGEEMPVDAPEATFTDGANEPEAPMVEPTMEDLAVETPAPKRRGRTIKSASVAQASTPTAENPAPVTRRAKRKVDDVAPESAEEELRPAKVTRTITGRQAKAASAEPKPSSTTGEGPSELSDTVVTDAMEMPAARPTKSVPRGRKTAAAKKVESSETLEAPVTAAEVPVTRRGTRSADTAAVVVTPVVPETEVEAAPRRRTRSGETAVKAPASKDSVPTRTRGRTRSSDVGTEVAAEEPEVVDETRAIKPLRKGRSMAVKAPESSSEPASTPAPRSGRGVKQAAHAMTEEPMEVEPEPTPAPKRSRRNAGKAEAVAPQPAKASRKRALPVEEDDEPAEEAVEAPGVPITKTRGRRAAAVVERGDNRPSPPKKSRSVEVPVEIEAAEPVLPKRARATRGRRATPSVAAQPEPVIEETTDKENSVAPVKTTRTRAPRAAAVTAEPPAPIRATRSRARK